MTSLFQTRSNLLIATGTHDILRLQDSRSQYKKIYLHPEDKRIPVPKYFWKVIADPEKRACVAFVCTNNPHLRRIPTKLCNDICLRSGWPIFSEADDREELSKGYVYCCEVEDLRRNIRTIPPLDCASLLVGPKAFYNYKEQ